MSASDTKFYEFGSFLLDTAEFSLARDGQIIPLTPKVFETLLVLVENSGHVVSKDELYKRVWQDAFVEETNLTKNISILRKILNNGGEGASFIETIPKRGYRFVAPVQWSGAEQTKNGLKPAAFLTDADEGRVESGVSFSRQPASVDKHFIAGVSQHKAAAIIAVAVLLLATLVVGMYWFRSDAAQRPQIKTLAVLPLKSLDPNDNAVGFGIADAVIRSLSQTGEMTVRPASSVRQYLTEDADAITAAKHLTVDAVLEGTIQRMGDRLRIGVNLLKGDGTSLWTDSFDTQMTDVFAVQDAISQQVASRLKVHLNTAQQARLTKRSTSNSIAYEYYIRGVYNYDQRDYGPAAKVQNDATIELFKKAIEADPNYALAYAGLADAYAFQGMFIVPGEQDNWIPLAKDAINRADAIVPHLPETHLARSQVLFSDSSGYQAAAAIREVLAAQQLDPNIGHHALGGLYNHIGLEDLAEREFGRAFEIDPTSKILASDYVSYYSLLHRPDENFAAQQKYFPDEPVSPLYYMMKGDLERAKQRIDEDAAKNKNRPNRFFTSYLLALKGEKKDSEELLAKVMSELPESVSRGTAYHHVTYDVACIYAINGNVPEAMKWLRDSAGRGNPSYSMFTRDPFLDKIRQSPEFIELMAELKLQYDKYRSEFH